MNKELRAFRKICKNLNSYEFTDEFKKNKELIETALKEQEEDKKLLNEQAKTNRYLMEQIKQSQNKLKALEIIKEKQVSIADFIYACMCSEKDLKEYHNCDSNYEFAATCVGWEKEYLTQKEYDLLKEVLL